MKWMQALLLPKTGGGGGGGGWAGETRVRACVAGDIPTSKDSVCVCVCVSERETECVCVSMYLTF